VPLVAIFTVRLPYGFSSIKPIAVTPASTDFGQPGYECDLPDLAGLGTLLPGGADPGRWTNCGASARGGPHRAPIPRDVPEWLRYSPRSHLAASTAK